MTYDDYLAVLNGREFTFSGRVVVCLNGVYSSVCDVDWDQNDADVFCNSDITGLPTSFGEGVLSRINCMSTDHRPVLFCLTFSLFKHVILALSLQLLLLSMA